MTDDIHQLQHTWQQYVTRPRAFVKRFWPQITLAPYQAEILDSVVNNQETWVHAANQMGKSFIAAVTAIWWFCTRRAKVVTASASEQQLSQVLWGEIDHLLGTARDQGQRYDFELERAALRLWLPADADRGAPCRKFYTLGQAAAAVESFQGHHLPPLPDGTGTVLFIFEEASALEAEFYEAASSQAHRLLAIGNPLRASGVFYEKCRAGDQRHPDGSGRLFRKVIQVSAEQSPNVVFAKKHIEADREGPPPVVVPGMITWSDFLARQANLPADQVRTRLLGLFPDEADERLFPAQWLDLAQQLGEALRRRMALEEGATSDGANRRARGRRFDRPLALGVDVAAGGDESAWVVLGRYGVREIVAKRTPDTSEIIGQTLRLARKYRIRPMAVAFDAGGGGQQIADVLRDRHGWDDLSLVRFGAASSKPGAYRNLRAELYGELRAMLEPARARRLLETPPERWERPARCLALPPDDGKLREELAVLPKLYDGQGRLVLPAKTRQGRREEGGPRQPTLRELLGRSPDRADALALALYGWNARRAYIAATTVPDHVRLVY